MYQDYEDKDDEFDECIEELEKVLRKYKMSLSFGSPRKQNAGTFLSLSRMDLPKGKGKRFLGQVIN